MHEDDVISTAARLLARNGARILAAGGKQTAAFRFPLPDGRAKSPDLVAASPIRLLVFEAKARAGALFASPDGSYSDLEAIGHLTRTRSIRESLVREANTLLRQFDESIPCAEGNLAAGLLAGTPLCTRRNRARAPELVLFQVDPEAEDHRVVHGQRDLTIAELLSGTET